jgi:DNA repair protein REV1
METDGDRMALSAEAEAKVAFPMSENRLKRSLPDSSDLSESSPPVDIPCGIEADTEIYGASRFGQFGEYMRRKRAKLQIQNANLEGSVEVGNKSTIFYDLAIYVSSLLPLGIRGPSSALFWTTD